MTNAEQLAALDRATAEIAKVRAAIAASTPAPPQYAGLTDRIVHPKPKPIVLGPAGSSWIDPTFGAKLWRVTDQNSNNGHACHTASAIGGAWNTNGSMFVVIGENGNALYFAFDGKTITPLTFAPTPTPYTEPWFSYVTPNVVYGASGSLRRTIYAYEIGGASKIVIDLDAAYPQLSLPADGYVGPTPFVDGDAFAVLFGGAGQNDHGYVHHSKYGLFDGIKHGFKMHGIGLDRLGRLMVNPNQDGLNAGFAQALLWNSIDDTLTPLTTIGGGHLQLGYGQMVNQDCCSASKWDAAQWQFRQLADVSVTMDLISPILTPSRDQNLVNLSDHTSWRNALSGKRLPILSSLYRRDLPLPDGTFPTPQPWRAWDDEVVTIATDGSGIVSRHCHHQSVLTGNFWDQPIAHINPQGTHAIFTSNWGQTVGAGRQDVFLVQLRS